MKETKAIIDNINSGLCLTIVGIGTITTSTSESEGWLLLVVT
jgi:hypothetical protein